MSHATTIEAGPSDAGGHRGAETRPRDVVTRATARAAPPTNQDPTRGPGPRRPNPAPVAAFSVFVAAVGILSAALVVAMELGLTG